MRRRSAWATCSAWSSSTRLVSFDGQTLNLLDRAQEVELETARPDGTLRHTTIWVVVDGGEVFVRSVRGDRGHWYQAALDAPEQVVLTVDGREMPVRVALTDDDASIKRCSDGLELKYRTDPALASMVRPHVLATTLRLEPRS